MAEQERIGLDNLAPAKGSKSSRKRVGRGHGSGSGKTSGRGHKGQKARSGASIPAWFEGGQMPLYRRTPKRGFTPPNRVVYAVVNLGDLERFEGDSIDPDALREQGLIGSPSLPVKILGDGEVTRSLTVTAHAFSASAREKIEAAGGTATVL